MHIDGGCLGHVECMLIEGHFTYINMYMYKTK